MEGLNQFPGNGWEKLPNRCLDPEYFDDEEQDNLDDYFADLEYDLLNEEGLYDSI